ncbi:hypothetical protein [Actinoplanes sp. NPDC049118]|uniref:hypothetical protein n=1 Tax=Actinoplanes sp. NPDC049118 TaxID=3155769 RepID=UPI0033C17C2D
MIVPVLALVFGLTTWTAGSLLPGAKAGDFNRWDLAIGIATTVIAATMWLWPASGAGPGERGTGQGGTGPVGPATIRAQVGDSSVRTAGGHQINLAGSAVIALAALAVLAIVVVSVVRDGAAGTRPEARPAPSSAGTAPAGAVRAKARWCCKLVQGDPGTATRYYWAGSAAALVSAKRAGRQPELPYVDEAAIEVAVQSATAETVLLQRVQVRVRERRENPEGLAVTFKCECGAGGDVRRFHTDLDDPRPTVRPERDDDSEDFYYVRPDSPEIFLLTVTAKKCDCLFDLELEWLAGEREGRTVLDNDGRHFRMIGGSGLTPYTLS